MRLPEDVDLRTYGQQLLAGREAKGWTQQELSKKLLLPIHFIRALEAGEHGVLPEIPYVMSMYRKVAAAVGVDPEAMIQACKALQAREEQPPAPQPQAVAPVAVPSLPLQEKRTDKGKGDGVILLVGCGLGLALVAVVLLNSELWPAIRSRLIPTNPDTEETAAETQGQTQEQRSEPVATQPPPTADIPDLPDLQPAPPRTEAGELNPGTVRFLFTADANDDLSSWIRIENASGVVLFQGVPEVATTLDLPTADGVRISAGRPGLVRWQQPGDPPRPLPAARANGWVSLIPGPVAIRELPPDPAPPDTAPAPSPATPLPAPEETP